MIKHAKSNFIQRKFIKKAETNILLFKTLLASRTTISHKTTLRYLLKEINLMFNRFSSRSRTRSVCILTGRTVGVYRKNFRVNRMQLKEKTLNGMFPGVKKSSW
jgi:ribosomal protein S14